MGVRDLQTLELVSAGPESERRMVVDSPDVVDHLRGNIVKERLIDRIQTVTELEFAPKKHPKLVRDIIDEVWKVGP